MVQQQETKTKTTKIKELSWTELHDITRGLIAFKSELQDREITLTVFGDMTKEDHQMKSIRERIQDIEALHKKIQLMAMYKK